jgi:hypothetical protein
MKTKIALIITIIAALAAPAADLKLVQISHVVAPRLPQTYLVVDGSSTNLPARTLVKWYVDKDAPGNRSGVSWSNAWHSTNEISGVHAGDMVFVRR